jgi:hypothetical protein
MSFASFLNGWHTRRNAPRANRACSVRRPRFETFEDRRLLSFTPASTYPVDEAPQAVVAADFNDDGQLDLATANAGSSSVSVLLGNEDGTFQAALDSTTGANPLSLAVGDFNADGKLDIATANSSNGSVLLGNGNGTFQSPTSVDIVGTPSSVAVGDFNGDGTLDLGVTSNVYYPGYYYYGYYGYNVGRANVLLGNGDGSFAAPTVAIEYGYLSSTTLADFNGDGELDFAAAIQDYGYVIVLPGTGTGSLGGATYSFSSYYTQSMAAGDVNDDGKLDLVAVTQYSDKVGVLLGTGTGSFAAPQYYSAGNYPTSVALGDFNGDGDLDIATASPGSNDVSILRGLGNGTFSPPEHFAAGPGAYAVAAGDFNGDGWLDAATADLYGNTASVLINDQSWPPLPPAVSVSVSDASVKEGKRGVTYMTFTVSLSGTDDAPVTVRYTTQNGTATAWSDYQPQTGTLTFAPGETTKTISIAVYGDRTIEPDETFQLVLSELTGNALISDPLGVGVIVNDDFHGRGSGKGHNQLAFALAVDTAIEDWMTGRPKKR